MSHISRMCSAMSCGMPSAGRGMFGLVERRPPALQLALLAGLLDALLDLADGVEVLVELALVGRADLRGGGRWRRRARRRARSCRPCCTSSLNRRSNARAG